jgi:hypothetical protein
MCASASPILSLPPAGNPYKSGTSRISAGLVPAVSLSHVVARIRLYFQGIAFVKTISTRQSRDKADQRTSMPRTLKELDGHILRDTTGAPVFVILEPGVQATYDFNLKRCELGWQRTADPAFLIDAIMWIGTHLQPLPLWLSKALISCLVKGRTKKQAADAYNAAIRFIRYSVVRDAQRSGKSWEQAYDQAAEDLAGTLAAAGPDMMKAAYIKVVADLKKGGKFYQFPRLFS